MAISGLLKPAHRLLRPGSLWISAPWGLQACRRRQNHTGGQKLRAPAAEQGSNGCGRTLWSQEKQAEEEDKQELSDSSPSSFSLRPILSSGMTMLEALASPVVNPMEDKRQREMQEVEVPPLCPEPDFLASSHEERRRSLFRPPEPCSLISSVLTGDWVQMLEAAVLELDGIVEHEVDSKQLRPSPYLSDSLLRHFSLADPPPSFRSAPPCPHPSRCFFLPPSSFLCLKDSFKSRRPSTGPCPRLFQSRGLFLL